MAETEPSRERRLLEVVSAYYESAGTGTEPDPRAWLERHPDLAPELPEFFAEQDRLRRIAAPPADPDFAPGDHEILRELGRGGMGVVFEARHRGLGRKVALKMLLSGQFASPGDRLRFRNETESVALLDHPNIIPIFEVGESGGRAYFTMKLVEGGSLADHLGEFAEDPARACRLLVIVGRAVHHAHRRGILHRDLKPSNILLDDRGQPFVADFGLARRIESGSDLTRSGALLGSPPYMAPEQADGKSGSVTIATDVYGLGAVLYALITGRPPFQGGSALEVIEKVRDQPPEPPSGINSRVDRDLETICLKALEKDPDRRYASAEAMADDLDRWLAGESIAARPSGRIDRLRRWCVRPQRVRDAGMLLLVLGLSLASFCAIGLVVLLFGSMGFTTPAATQVHIIRCIFLFYLPMAAWGRYMIARKTWALWAGLGQCSLLTIYLLLSLIFNIIPLDFGAGDGDARAGRFAFEALCATLFGFEALACLVALAAHYSNRSLLRRRGSLAGPSPA